MHRPINEAEFVKEVTRDLTMASFNLFKAAWEPSQEKGQEKGKPSGPNPFLAPLTAGLSVIGDQTWKQIEADINDALKRNIY